MPIRLLSTVVIQLHRPCAALAVAWGARSSVSTAIATWGSRRRPSSLETREVRRDRARLGFAEPERRHLRSRLETLGIEDPRGDVVDGVGQHPGGERPALAEVR